MVPLSSSRRRQAGFSFIEILVVMGIISVLATMVVVLIPIVTEKSNQTKSKDNLGNLAKMMISRGSSKVSGKWAKYDGKNFVLSVVAHGSLNKKNTRALTNLFSPGDEWYTADDVDWKRYLEITKDALKGGADFKELTSYGGRRNTEKEYLLTQASVDEGVIIMCDDDDGPLHHSGGLCVAFADGGAAFLDWDELGMSEPDNPKDPAPFLGEEATADKLMGLRGR